MQLTDLPLKWRKLFLPFQSQPNLVKEIFSDLMTAYSTKNRYYHNLFHIQHVLSIADILNYMADSFPSVQMAVWFHDVIYDTKAKDNEEKSAEYASTCLTKLNIPLTMINHVVSMILNTKNHSALIYDIDSQILLDADLSILGSEQSVYKAYALSIRREYSWISDAEYRIARKKVLQKFLERDRIYFTEKAFHMLESKATENLKVEISNL